MARRRNQRHLKAVETLIHSREPQKHPSHFSLRVGDCLSDYAALIDLRDCGSRA